MLRRLSFRTGLVLASVAAIGPAQAGFLDQLFGVATPSPRLTYPDSDPLNVTIRKLPRKKAATALASERPPILQRSTLDPAKDPHWYLKDETLRRGDIVVLPNRVLIVRDKAATFRSSGFEDIRQSVALSSRERARILAMTEFRSGVTPAKYKVIPEPRNTPDAISLLDRSSVPIIMP